MKKQLVKTILIMLVMIAMIINLAGTVNAASSLDARLSATPAELETGKEITVTITLANINVGEGVNTFKGTLTWDKDVLEFVDYNKTVNDWSSTWNPSDGTLVSFHMSGLVKTDTAVAKLIFKVKDVEELEDTTITLTNIESANTEEKVIPANASITLKVPVAETPDDDNNNNTNNENVTTGNNTTENSTTGNNTTGNSTTGNNITTNNNKPATTTTNTSANKIIPHAGVGNTIIMISISALVVLGIVSLVQYKKYKDI